MTVTSIASIAAGISRTLGNNNAKVASSIQSLVGGAGVSPETTDVSDIGLASSLQGQVASLRSATQNLAQAASLVRVAQSGVTDISNTLARLQQISQEATSTSLSPEERTALNTEFQQLRQQIDQTAKDTSFGNQKLLDGSFTGQSLQLGDSSSADGSDSGFSIPSLTDASLFSTNDVSLLSADGAQKAATAVQNAQSTVNDQQISLGALDQGINVAFASIETAAVNQDAASATLTEADFAQTATQSQQAQVQAQATAALVAQTNKLPNNILALLTD